MTDDELRALRAAVDHREGRGRTHWEGCHLDSSHRDCAIVRLLDEVERLTAWKAEMLAVLAPCDLQAVAKLLGIPLGHAIYEELQPAVERVLAERDRATRLANEAQESLAAYVDATGIVEKVGYADSLHRAIHKEAERGAALAIERDKLQAFKSWVHNYLDAKGVPHHPPGPHGAEGCRIGDRLDWVWKELDRWNRVKERIAWHRDGHGPDVPVLQDRYDRIREALSWAVGFIRCNFPKASEQYEDMRNAEAIADAVPLHSGEFHRASARAELAEAERDRLAARVAVLEAALQSVNKYDADDHYDSNGNTTGAFVIDGDTWGQLKDAAAALLAETSETKS